MDRDTAMETGAHDPIDLAWRILAAVFLAYVATGFPIALSGDLRTIDTAIHRGRRRVRAWSAAMALIAAMAWLWLSLVAAMLSSGDGEGNDHDD